MEAKSAYHITRGLHSGFDYCSELFMAWLVFLRVVMAMPSGFLIIFQQEEAGLC